MDLKAATEQEIRDELERRQMVREDTRIRDLFNEITIAYNSGKISSISIEEKNKGTSVATKSYYVFLK